MGSGASQVKDVARKGTLKVMQGRKSFHVPTIRRSGSNERNFLGVALVFEQNQANSAPKGCVRCDCERKYDLKGIEISADLHVNEYIEEERKSLAKWAKDANRSGRTERGAKYVGPWYHPETVGDIPKEVNELKPALNGEWTELWHVTAWTVFTDPYSHQTSRFRVWRRVERTAQKPKPAALEEVEVKGEEATKDAAVTEKDEEADAAEKATVDDATVDDATVDDATEDAKKT